MVRIINAFECDCGSCNGGTPAPPGHFGGSHCACRCHQLKGPERAAYIAYKSASLSELIARTTKEQAP